MPLKIEIDAAGIASQFKEFAKQVEQDIKKAVAQLAPMTHAEVKMKANKELKSSRNKYLDALGWEQISDNVHIVFLDAPALWIEEGIPENFDMKPGLLNGKNKRVIPFRYDKAPQDSTPYTQNLINQVKGEFRKRNIPLKKIETDNRGNPLLGKIHEFNFDSQRPGRGNTPTLTRLSVYQREIQNKATQRTEIARSVLTFRTVSSGPASAGKWHHPGAKGKKFLDEACDWAINKFENEILPEIMNKWSK